MASARSGRWSGGWPGLELSQRQISLGKRPQPEGSVRTRPERGIAHQTFGVDIHALAVVLDEQLLEGTVPRVRPDGRYAPELLVALGPLDDLDLVRMNVDARRMPLACARCVGHSSIEEKVRAAHTAFGRKSVATAGPILPPGPREPRSTWSRSLTRGRQSRSRASSSWAGSRSSTPR